MASKQSQYITVSNETESSMSRSTKDGRKLTYEMKVLQQPARARACGSGAKSSADRRPVDPPPVVELRVFEGDAKTDITFSHNANFFLYTTLESARPIAQGRSGAGATPFPVLTGMPVAGMAYLDRPSPAGYFIFPDLSVRHEGVYRLSFNLFEELKEGKDADMDSGLNGQDHASAKLPRNTLVAPQAHVHFRLEVKSEPFVVFSAKKFPGLSESTALSRVVAEQGCRVRIRRDVRMRRRDNKPSKDYDEYSEEGAPYSRPERYATPEGYTSRPMSDRARSVSNVSVDGNASYPSIERRPSSHDLGYYNPPHYQPQPTAAIPQPVSNNFGGHLAFGGASAPQYVTPVPSSNAQPPSSYAPQSSTYQYPSTAVKQPSNGQPYGHPLNSIYPTPPYQPPSPYHEAPDYKPVQDYRNAAPAYSGHSSPSSYSVPDGRHSQSQSQSQSQAQSQSQGQSQHAYTQGPHTASPRSISPLDAQLLPPLKAIQPSERKYDQPSATGMMPGPILPQSNYGMTPSTHAPYSAPAASPTTSSAPRAKRAYGSVFDTTHLNQSFHHDGVRPDVINHGRDVQQIALDDGSLVDEPDFADLKLLVYKRADGSKQHKKCPIPAT